METTLRAVPVVPTTDPVRAWYRGQYFRAISGGKMFTVADSKHLKQTLGYDSVTVDLSTIKLVA